MFSYFMCRSENTYNFVFSRAPQNKPLDWIATEDFDIKPASVKTMEIITPIGKGNFGDVFMVMNQSSQKYCAVKFISKQAVFERNMIDHLQREIDIVPKLKNTFILEFFAAYETPSCIGLAFELAYGGVLSDRILFRGYLPPLEAKFYFCEILSGLAFLHETVGIIHRDIRTTNILLDSMGHVKLSEFGMAALISDTARLNDHINNNSNNNNLAMTDSTFNSSQHSNNRDKTTDSNNNHHSNKNNNNNDGSKSIDKCINNSQNNVYMAPELFSKESSIMQGCEKKIDFFSLGCILLEMVTGNPPAPNNSLTRFAPSLSFLMGQSLKQLIRGLLTKDPVQRWGSKEVMMSCWIEEMNWEKLEDRRCFPPWVPVASHQPTLKYFQPVGDFIDSMQTMEDPKIDYYFKKLRLPSNLKMPSSSSGRAGGGGMPSKRNSTNSNSNKNNNNKSVSLLIMSTKEMNQQLLAINSSHNHLLNSNTNSSGSSRISNGNGSCKNTSNTTAIVGAQLKIKQRVKSNTNDNNSNSYSDLSIIRNEKSHNNSDSHNSSNHSSVRSNNNSSHNILYQDNSSSSSSIHNSSNRYTVGRKSSSVAPITDSNSSSSSGSSSSATNENDANGHNAIIPSSGSVHRRQSSTAKLLAPSLRGSSRLSRNDSSVGSISSSNGNSFYGGSSRSNSLHRLNAINNDKDDDNNDDDDEKLKKNNRRNSSGSNSSNNSCKHYNDDDGYGISPNLLAAASSMNLFNSNNSIHSSSSNHTSITSSNDHNDRNNNNNNNANTTSHRCSNKVIEFQDDDDNNNSNRSHNHKNNNNNSKRVCSTPTVASAAAAAASGRKKSVKFGENVDLVDQGPAATATAVNGRVSRGNSTSNVHNNGSNSNSSSAEVGSLMRRKSDNRMISGKVKYN